MRDWAWHPSPSKVRRAPMGRVTSPIVSETCCSRRGCESSHEKLDKPTLKDMPQNNWLVYSRMSRIWKPKRDRGTAPNRRIVSDPVTK